MNFSFNVENSLKHSAVNLGFKLKNSKLKTGGNKRNEEKQCRSLL